MADLTSVQTFSPTSFGSEPVVKRTQGVNTPLSMLELANTARSMTALQKEQALLQPSIEKGKAESTQQVLAAEKAGVDLNQHYANLTRSVYGGYLTDPDFINGNSAAMIKKLNQGKSFLNGVGVPEYNKGQAHKELLTLAETNPQEANQYIRNITQQGAGNVEQAAQLNKAPTYLNLGNRVEAVPTSPYQGVNPNYKVGTGLAPQVVTNQITGANYVMGGGFNPVSQLANAPQAQVNPQNAPPVTQPNAPPVTQLNAPTGGGQAPATGQRKESNNGFVQGPNEPKDAFIARSAAPQNSYAKAQDQFNNINSEFGHIPTIKNINTNIMKYLKDDKVRTGAVQEYLAGKTKKETLSDDEQSLAKELEKRIQNLKSSSDKDADSKRAAYGTFGLKKEALKEIVRNDNAWLTQQELQAKGILNNGGAGANPNYVKVDQFNKQFAQLSQNDNLMKYIAIVGDNPDRIQVDKDDVAAATKYFGKLSNEQKDKLEMQRKTLLKIVEGK
jgi:hypothetical protein